MCVSLHSRKTVDSGIKLAEESLDLSPEPEVSVPIRLCRDMFSMKDSSRTYREVDYRLYSEAYDSEEQCSVRLDSGAECFESQDTFVVSANSGNMSDAQCRGATSFQNTGGAVFACGTLGPMHHDFSKLSLDIAKAEPSADIGCMARKAEKKMPTAEEQFTVKRLKCLAKPDLFDIKDLLTPTTEIPETQEARPQNEVEDNHSVVAEPHDVFQSLRDQDEDGDTLLHIALILNRTDVVWNLLNYVSNANDLSIQNHLGQTVLHLAVLLDLAELLRKFVLQGAQITVQDRSGNSPLHLACAKGKIESIVALTRPPTSEEHLGCYYNHRVPFHRIPQDPDLRNFQGLTCLHVAADHGFLTVVNYLVQYCGADINAVEYKAGETILHRAVQENNLELVRYLLSFAEVDVDAQRYDGCTPIQLAQGQRNDMMAEMLEDRGAVIDSTEIDHEGITSNIETITLDTDYDYDDFKIGGSLVT